MEAATAAGKTESSSAGVMAPARYAKKHAAASAWCSSRECTRRGRDQRVHRNRATLVTPTVRYPALNLSHDQQPHVRVERHDAHDTQGDTNDDEAQNRDTQRVARRAAQAARGGEG